MRKVSCTAALSVCGVSDAASPARAAMWSVIKDVVQHDLTDRQRHVLNLVVINGVDADEVAERLGVSAGARYKLTHDARRKLKAGLLARGYSTVEILEAFAAQG